MHPESWDCPEMQSEVRLRLAMDNLKKAAAAVWSDGNGNGSGNGGSGNAKVNGVEMGVEELGRKWKVLSGKLRALRGAGAGVSGQ
jgi:hypothetical protein